jgi:hypothetical protein
MMPALLLAAAGALAFAGVERELLAGLAVSVDPVPETVVIDGLGMIMQRVTGSGVPDLIRRIEARWRGQGSQIQQLDQGGWVLRSRIHGKHSEVIQWRSTASDMELLWSRLDVAASVQPEPAKLFALPAGCAWSRSISGMSGHQRYLQRSARCSHGASDLARSLRASLSSQGWQVHSASSQGLLVRRAGVEGLLSLNVQQEGLTWLVWLQVEGVP